MRKKDLSMDCVKSPRKGRITYTIFQEFDRHFECASTSDKTIILVWLFIKGIDAEDREEVGLVLENEDGLVHNKIMSPLRQAVAMVCWGFLEQLRCHRGSILLGWYYTEESIIYMEFKCKWTIWNLEMHILHMFLFWSMLPKKPFRYKLMHLILHSKVSYHKTKTTRSYIYTIPTHRNLMLRKLNMRFTKWNVWLL